MLKQSIIVVSAKKKQFTERTTQYHHNKLFEKDQKRFYEMLEDKKQTIPQPDADEAKSFWSKIRGNACKNRQIAGWPSKVQDENAAAEAQQEFLITVEMVQKACKNMSPWKAAGPDGVQGYWIKEFATLHGRVAHQLNA